MTYLTDLDSSIAVLAESAIQPMQRSSRHSSDMRHTLTGALKSIDIELPFANGEKMTARLIGNGNEPSALWTIFSAFQRLAQLAPNWDSYGAMPLNPKTVRRSFDLLPGLFTEDVPAPSVVPTRDGGVQFEWHCRGIDLEIKVPPAKPISYVIVDTHSGAEIEGEGKLDLQRIHALFAHVPRAS
jgi:hypothetical protein